MPFYTEKWPKNGPFQHCWGILFSYFIPPEVPFGMPKAGTLRNCEIYSINSDFTGFSPFIVAIMKKLKNVIQDFTIYSHAHYDVTRISRISWLIETIFDDS